MSRFDNCAHGSSTPLCSTVNAVVDTRLERKRRIGRAVATARADAGYGQVRFAALVGVSQSHLSKWENGRSRPSDEYLDRIAALTGRTAGWFLDYDGDGNGAGQ
jgi:DNA-binding XRE family transcriptional regulator